MRNACFGVVAFVSLYLVSEAFCDIPSFSSQEPSANHLTPHTEGQESRAIKRTRDDSSRKQVGSYKSGSLGGSGGSGGGGHRKKNKGGDLMSKILPMLVTPFLISSSIIPMMLTSLKFMLLKSLFVGKMAIILIAINALWRSQNRGGVYSHNVNIDDHQHDLNMEHYGYSGITEVGAYVNRRRRKS